MSGSKSRRKGHGFERQIAKDLRELGFTGVVTSRYASRLEDDNKVDLIDLEKKLPIAIQAKAGYNFSLEAILKELQAMKTDLPKAVFNKKSRSTDLVIMTRSDFYNLLAEWQTK